MPVSAVSVNDPTQQAYWRLAWILALSTVVYNVVEGAVSIWFGAEDEALTLFGFGIDSVIEVISAIGVAHMVLRLRKHGTERRDEFEKTALQITGWSFYGLAAMLVITAALSAYAGHTPESTVSGVIISLISISFMWALIRGKINVGTALNCAPIIADANCSKVCLRMSVILLASSAVYELFHIGYIDAIGAAILAWYSWKEGRECLDKAKGHECCDTCS